MIRKEEEAREALAIKMNDWKEVQFNLKEERKKNKRCAEPTLTEMFLEEKESELESKIAVLKWMLNELDVI